MPTPIVFLHGVGSDKSVWRPQLEPFRRVAAAPSPSTIPAMAKAIFCRTRGRDDFAAAILAAMDALGIERAHVCGLSLGGVVAIAMHAAAPSAAPR